MNQENKPIKPNINFSYSIYPVKLLDHHFSTKISVINSELLKQFYSESVSKKVNVIISELFNNVLENTINKQTETRVNVQVADDLLIIQVKNYAPIDTYEKVKKHVYSITRSKDAKKLLAQTIHEKRKNNETGGLGLIRLIAENKVKLFTQYNKKSSYLTIKSKLCLKDVS